VQNSKCKMWYTALQLCILHF